LLGHAEVVEAAVIGYPSSARDLRSPELDETQPEVRLAFLGDSLTLDKAAGANEATWPHRVWERLSTLLPDVRCDHLNAAVRACKTEQMLNILRDSVAPLRPDVIVIQPGGGCSPTALPLDYMKHSP
jgi:hypothetical protein